MQAHNSRKKIHNLPFWWLLGKVTRDCTYQFSFKSSHYSIQCSHPPRRHRTIVNLHWKNGPLGLILQQYQELTRTYSNCPEHVRSLRRGSSLYILEPRNRQLLINLRAVSAPSSTLRFPHGKFDASALKSRQEQHHRRHPSYPIKNCPLVQLAPIFCFAPLPFKIHSPRQLLVQQHRLHWPVFDWQEDHLARCRWNNSLSRITLDPLSQCRKDLASAPTLLDWRLH